MNPTDLPTGSSSPIGLSGHLAGALPVAPADGVQASQHARQQTRKNAEIADLTALVELVTQIHCCDDFPSACRLVVTELPKFLHVDRAAIAWFRRQRRDRGSRLRVMALSHVPRLEPDSALCKALDAALAESVLRDRLTMWPALRDDRGLTLSHRRLGQLAGQDLIVSSPLYNHRGDLVGAWLMMASGPWSSHGQAVARLREFQRPVASALGALARTESGWLARKSRQLAPAARHWKGKLVLGLVSCLLIMLFVPWPYRIRCKFQLQPVERQFVVAPYDGILESTLVDPGDTVTAGSVLARMDGREIRWELAGLEAQLNRVKKQRDAAMASHNVSTAQQAKLEMRRLELKIRLLERRMASLDIKTPLSGIVVSGDLRSARGAPLAVGQQLFEIAPLDQMVVELSIPEDEIAYAGAGRQVTLRLDAFPGETWNGVLSAIHPRAQIRDDESVFIGEMKLNNGSQSLRPGMRGRATIHGPRHPVGWNLLHRPYEALLRMVGW